MDVRTDRNDSQNIQWKSAPWKEWPCHFTWNLKVEVLVDYHKIVRNVGHDLEETPNLLGIEGLLFRAYLEVWDSRYRWDVCKAREYLDKADECIKRTDKKLQTGYRVVALLNRVWIEHKSHNTPKVKELLTRLGALELDYKDICVIGAVQATALARLGPRVIDTALERYEAALQLFPENPGFLFGAALLAGRKCRSENREYEALDTVDKTFMDKERDYWKRMINCKDEYQLARSSLGLNLSRRGKKDGKEGCRFLKMAYEKAPGVQEVCRNLARGYRSSHKLDEAISTLNKEIRRSPNCPETHYQLALCYISNAKKDSREAEKWNERALKELDECLRLYQGHIYALRDKCEVLTVLGRIEEADKIYDNRLQQSEHETTNAKINLYFKFATFLDRNPKASRHESRMDMWRKVMDTAGSFEYLDDVSGEWKIKKMAKSSKEKAYTKLLEHYKRRSSLSLVLGILHFQNFDFNKAEKVLTQLDSTTDYNVSRYLAQTHLKWGLQKEVQELSQKRKPEEATSHFSKAHKNVLQATKLGLKLTEGRQLLADVALAMAHNQLQVTNEVQSQGATVGDQGARRTESTPVTIPLESPCIQSYREAVTCGSLVASVELLRLIQNGHVQVTSTWQLLQILAEMDVCCSQRSSDYLHQENHPLSLKEGLNSRVRDDNLSVMNSKTIKRDIMAVWRQDTFYRQAWKEHFNMEREILLERFLNNEGELEMDGREDDTKTNLSEEIIHAATDCCEKLRPLLDRIVVKFGKEELNIEEERKNQYFPLISDEKNAAEIEDQIRKSLKSIFGIDMDKHYPKLFNHILQIQPARDSQNDFLKTFCTLVNKIKHSDIKLTVILEIVQDPVTLARQCTDKIEEICNFFFDAMRESKCLGETVEQMLSDIRGGQHKRSDQLLEVLSRNQDFIFRMGSTWRLLEMVALIHQGRETTELSGTESQLVNGKCAITHRLRQRHLEVEVSVLQANFQTVLNSSECRDTCREAVRVLDSLLADIKNAKELRVKTTTFPLHDLHPGDDILQRNEAGHWEGVVKKQLKKDLKEMGIPANKKLLDIILQAQPCVSEENYQFLAVKSFLEKCDGDDGTLIPDTVCILTASGKNKSFQVLDLTRWCTDNAEKFAIEIHNV